jgi:8-oxo-dGTP pyrophosphatase MutT (NUDIX family)
VTISIRRVARVEARSEAYEWPWAIENRELIADHWARRGAEQPRLFNGEVLLASDLEFTDDTLRITFFRTDYASLLGLTELGPGVATGAGDPGGGVVNAFALGALRAADGPFVLGIMGGHTANAGRAYFPAGTPDPSDLTEGGEVDLLGSVVRELHEETGLEPGAYTVGEGWTVVEAGPLVALFRPVRLRRDAATIERTIARHLARDPDAELAGVRLVRRLEDLDDAVMPPYLTAYLRDCFTTGRD